MKRLLYRNNLKNKLLSKKSYFRILFTVTLCTVTIVLIFFSLAYGRTKELITQQSIELSLQGFNQIQAVVENMTSTATSLGLQITLDERCSKVLLASEGKAVSPIESAGVSRQLKLYQSLHENIESIYLYNKKADYIISTRGGTIHKGIENFFDQDLVQWMKDYKQALSPGITKRTIAKSRTHGYIMDTDVLTYVLPNIYDGSRMDTAVIINFSTTWLNKKIAEVQEKDGGPIAIIDGGKDGALHLINNTLNVPLEEVLPAAKAIIELDSNYLEYDQKGNKLFLSHFYADNPGWHFVKFSEWEGVFSLLISFQDGIKILLLSIILAAILISAIGAGGIYKSFHVIERQYDKLMGNRRLNAEQLRESYLSEFLYRTKLLKKEQILSKLREDGFLLPENGAYTIAVLYIDGYDSLKAGSRPEDVYSMKYGIRNIFEEIFGKAFHVIGLLGKENQMVFILGKNDTLSSASYNLPSLFQLFSSSALSFIENRYNLLITGEYTGIENLPELWSQMRPCLHEVFFYPSGTIVRCEDVYEQHFDKVKKSSLDHNILTSMISASPEETMVHFDQFVGEIYTCKYQQFMNVLTWLIFTITNTLDGLPYGDGEESLASGFSDLLVKLAACEHMTDVRKLFYSLFTRIRELTEAANSKSGLMGKIEAVQHFVAENYADPNLSLDSIAEVFGASPSYFGKMFKKATALSVQDYISQIRLEQVIAQMTATTMPIKDIVAACGFGSTNYFFTYFKKKYGVTPQAYRDSLKK